MIKTRIGGIKTGKRSIDKKRSIPLLHRRCLCDKKFIAISISTLFYETYKSAYEIHSQYLHTFICTLSTEQKGIAILIK